MTGYSGTPLVKKLGIKENFIIKLVNCPQNYAQIVRDIPKSVCIETNEKAEVDFIHIFATYFNDLKSYLFKAKKQVKKSGMIWVSWPKKSSKVPTDLDENKIRELALEYGLVDVKVCAVDEVWSGLKLIYRLSDR